MKFAKANPGKLKVATAGYGTLDDIAIKYLGSLGYKMVNVPYAKPAERYAAAVGKHTDILYEEPGDVDKFLAAKQLRPIVVFDNQRHAKFPDVPTAKEAGQPLAQNNWRAIVAPANISPAAAKALNAALGKVIASAGWKAFCKKTYTCTKTRNPAEITMFVEQTYDDVGKFIDKFGLRKK